MPHGSNVSHKNVANISASFKLAIKLSAQLPRFQNSKLSTLSKCILELANPLVSASLRLNDFMMSKMLQTQLMFSCLCQSKLTTETGFLTFTKRQVVLLPNLLSSFQTISQQWRDITAVLLSLREIIQFRAALSKQKSHHLQCLLRSN